MKTDRQRQLNADVTLAILNAEHCNTIDLWRRVLELETALVDEAETEIERSVARAGVVSANLRILELSK